MRLLRKYLLLKARYYRRGWWFWRDYPPESAGYQFGLLSKQIGELYRALEEAIA